MFNPVAPLTIRTVDGTAQIGRTLHDLRGIRYENGESGNTPPATPPAPATTPETPPGHASKPPWGDDPAKFDPAKAWKLIQNVKTDLAEQKTKTDAAIAAAAEKAQKDTLAQFAKLLSGEKEPETDPAKLAQTIAEKDTALTAAQTAAKDSARTIAVLSNPAIRDANSKLLLANKAFTDSIGSVEPTDEAAITAAIHQALQANAALKATPSRSGGGEHQGATVQSLEGQLAAATKAKDFTETIRLKQAISAAKRRAAQT